MAKLREALGVKLDPVEMGRLYLSKSEAEEILERLEDLAYLRK